MEAPATVKSAMRTLDILEFLVSQGRPMAAHELASALAIPVSSLSYLLNTLVERGYLERSGRQYAPGPALARLSGGAPDLGARVAPLVHSLRVQLNETAGFFVRRGWVIEAVASEIGVHVLRYTLEVGRQAPMHAFSAGKALLAVMSETELAQYFREADRPAYTAQTVYAEGAMRAELETIRRTGIATSREEHTPGIIGLSRAAYMDGEVVGAFSVAMPLTRFDDDVRERVSEALKRATEMLAGGVG